MSSLSKLSQLNPHHHDLNKRISFMLEVLTNEDIDGILMLTYPGIYEVVPRELLREKVIETFHSDEMTVSMDLFDVDAVGKIIEHNEGRYAQVNYTMLMAMRMQEKEDDPDKQTEHKQFLMRMFKAFYGEANTWFEETTQCYCFYKKNIMIAIEDHRSPQWTFLTYQKGTDMSLFLPKDVLLLLNLDAPGDQE